MDHWWRQAVLVLQEQGFADVELLFPLGVLQN